VDRVARQLEDLRRRIGAIAEAEARTAAKARAARREEIERVIAELGKLRGAYADYLEPDELDLVRDIERRIAEMAGVIVRGLKS
jgi:hypothetical protein